MFVSDGLGVNESGHLTVGGCDTVSLAKKYGTPYMCYDENMIRKNCREFVKSMEENYDGNGLVCYASKAFSCLEMCRICKEEKMGLDVVSGGEIFTAVKAGFPSERICFHGNNKTNDELTMALDNNVGRIVVDNVEELKRLSTLASKIGKVAKIMLRIKPGIDAHTHSFIRTGQIDSKFGFALETGEAMTAVKLAVETDSIDLCGLHCHIGSQIFDIAPFELAAKVMIDFISEIKETVGYEIRELNLGGGFGIKYLESDTPKPFSEYMKRVSVVVKNEAEKKNVKRPFILIEPGRSVVGAEGVTKTEKVTVAGKCCESGDLIQENAPIQKVEAGDLLAVLSTGAYNYSMASNYNRIPRPIVIMAKDGESRIIIRRETYEDITRNDV